MCRRVYNSLYKSISENFQEHLRFLELNELDQLNASIKTNGRGLKKKEDYSSPFELIKSVGTSYYLNGGILVTNGLLWIPNGDKPDFISGTISGNMSARTSYNSISFSSKFIFWSKRRNLKKCIVNLLLQVLSKTETRIELEIDEITKLQQK